MAILTVNNIRQSFGEEVILQEVTFELQKGERVGLVGVNGSGKTTLFKVLTGEYSPDTGSVTFGKDTVLGYMEQHVCRDFHKTAFDEVMTVFAPLLRLERELEDVTALLAEHPSGEDMERLIQRQTDLNERFVDAGGLTCRSRARSALLGLGFEESQLQNKVGVLSGGQKAKLQLAKMLLSGANLLLLDEPFSALDPMTRRSLQQEVRSLQQKLNKTFVFVTHDMEEALDLADVIIFMDHGKIVQMAPPEEMLAHPASGQIQDFLGKFIDTHAQKELTAADFMRPGVSTVSATRGVNECVSKMQRRNVDTLIVVDDQDRYQGTVSIADIRLTGHVVKTIEPLIRCNTPTVHTGDSAKDCFDLLISSGAPYLIVLDEEEKVDGLITKTSMTSAMAEQLWG